MFILIPTLIDIHTLFVLIFFEYLPPMYVLAGSTFAIIKGIFFFLPTRNSFSAIDIIIGIIMLFLLAGPLWDFLFWSIFTFLSYMIVLSIASLK